MLSGDGNEDSQNKLVGLISKEKTLHVQNTFFVHFSTVVLLHYNENRNFQKLPCYTFYGGNFVCVLVHFSFAAASFHLGDR